MHRSDRRFIGRPRERVLAAKETGVSYYVLKPIDAPRFGQVVSRLASQLGLE